MWSLRGARRVQAGDPRTGAQADGATIQKTNQVAIAGGTSDISSCLNMVKKAREMGLTVPVVLMGYYNPFFQFGIENMCAKAKEYGADGFIVVDFPGSNNGSMFSLSIIFVGLSFATKGSLLPSSCSLMFTS